jgi:hypothetical protein
MYSGERLHVASGPRCRCITLEISGRHALGIGEIRNAAVIARNAAVCVICAVDLKRPEAATAVAYDWTVPA